jgi:YHS domain-containing protein
MQRLALRSTVLALSLLASCATSRTSPARSTTTPEIHPQVLVNRDHHGIALGGYDPVAYFSDKKPVSGKPAYQAVHDGAVYYFASDAHRWQFLRDPERYAPAFGGYCGYAASIGRVSPVNPQFFQIIDNRLVLQHNQHAFDLFNQDASGNLSRADKNWPKLSAHNALPSHYVVNATPEGIAIGGYDPISYFEGTPTLGSAEHAARYGGATYRFVSEANRAKFEGDPARYAPAFGGFCGYAASIGRIAPINPSIFVIVDGHLVLQHTREALDLFNRDARKSLTAAEHNWPTLVARAGL